MQRKVAMTDLVEHIQNTTITALVAVNRGGMRSCVDFITTYTSLTMQCFAADFEKSEPKKSP